MEARPTEPIEAPSPPSRQRRSAWPLTLPRFAVLAAGLVVLWVVGSFAGQVGDAATAANEADQMRARNAAMERDLTSLESELKLIQDPNFVAQMARGYLLGSPREVPFSIDPKASPLPADAPGSVGIGAVAQPGPGSPLEAWLRALFGSSS